MSEYSYKDLFLWMGFLSKCSKIMLPKLIKMWTRTCAHIHTYLHGTMFVFWVFDNKYQMVCLAMAFYYDNGSENNLTKFLSFLKYVFPIIEKLKAYIIADLLEPEVFFI